jgi:hypothetical protein
VLRCIPEQPTCSDAGKVHTKLGCG